MERRAGKALIGLLGVCCLVSASSIVYPLSFTKPHASEPSHERFSVSESDSYRARGRIVVDSSVKLAFEAVETAADERYLMVNESGVRSERYQAAPNASVYERIVVDHEKAAQLRAEISSDEDRRLLWKNRSTERVVLVVEGDPTTAGSLTGPAAVVVRTLHTASYGTEKRNSSAAMVHTPRNGWYDGTQPYRVTEASGEVRTGAGSSAVESARVTWGITTPAGSYAEYALARLLGTGPRTHAVSYELDEGTPELDRPAWADEHSRNFSRGRSKPKQTARTHQGAATKAPRAATTPMDLFPDRSACEPPRGQVVRDTERLVICSRRLRRSQVRRTSSHAYHGTLRFPYDPGAFSPNSV